MISIKEALSYGAKELKGIADNPKKEAMILLSFILKKDNVYIFLHENDEFNFFNEYKKILKRRIVFEPIEYIINSVSFYSKQFFIDKGALIPRPETELLIDEILKNIENKNQILNIAEIGTGSGVISIILALSLKNAHFIATDISNDALKIAEKNINNFNLKDKIELFQTSYLDNISDKIDILISNPPYVANEFKIDKSLEYEPKEAIFGGEKGYEIYENIIQIAKEKDVKLLSCEIGYDQKKPISSILRKKGFKNFYFYKDLANLDRGFIVKNHSLL